MYHEVKTRWRTFYPAVGRGDLVRKLVVTNECRCGSKVSAHTELGELYCDDSGEELASLHMDFMGSAEDTLRDREHDLAVCA